MCEWFGQAQAGEELPQEWCASELLVPLLGTVPIPGSVAGATAGGAHLLPVLDGGSSWTAGTTLNGGRMPCVRRLIGCSWGMMLALFTTVSGAARPSEAGSGDSSPPAAREAMRNLLTRAATALDIKLVDSDDFPSQLSSARRCRRAGPLSGGASDSQQRLDHGVMFAGAESFGLWEYPIIDTMIGAMVLPHREIIGWNLRLKPGPPRVFDADLKATYGSLCFLGCPTNCLTMQLQAYLHTLFPRLQEGTEKLLR
nr:uncharacterized protein LOC112080541 [Salvelinus alpinus]